MEEGAVLGKSEIRWFLVDRSSSVYLHYFYSLVRFFCLVSLVVLQVVGQC